MEDLIMMPMRKYNDQNWLPSIFNDFFDNDWMFKSNSTSPAINVVEEDDAYKVEVAAPGMTKDDFHVYLSDEDHLTIGVEKKDEKNEEDNNKKYLRREFSYSKFQQTMALPEDVDRENISATVVDGVLKIDLHKKAIDAKQEEPRMIEIK